jgi:hypothetical protein
MSFALKTKIFLKKSIDGGKILGSIGNGRENLKNGGQYRRISPTYVKHNCVTVVFGVYFAPHSVTATPFSVMQTFFWCVYFLMF